MRIRLLGGFQLARNGMRVAVPAAGQRLLAFLGVRGQVSRSLAAGTLWAEVTDEHALGSLRSTIWRLNRGGLRLMTTHADTLSLSPVIRTDVGSFTTAAATINAGRDHGEEEREQVLAAGELLPGWYEDWVLLERERLRQVRLHVLEILSARFTANRQFAPALDVALETVRVDPLRESAHRAVVAVHLAENNVAEAVRHYRGFRTLLLGELGIEPSPEFTAMLPGQALVRMV
ncbi:BTAD domain-containing putative transcriptional regulator [Actinophytocola sp.]|uniref:AfsR/SARP family transcriptional regulator n=1 Tax=Actinophytocola sp. TaxID=1872138 RepID=UPI00389B26D9